MECECALPFKSLPPPPPGFLSGRRERTVGCLALRNVEAAMLPSRSSPEQAGGGERTELSRTEKAWWGTSGSPRAGKGTRLSPSLARILPCWARGGGSERSEGREKMAAGIRPLPAGLRDSSSPLQAGCWRAFPPPPRLQWFLRSPSPARSCLHRPLPAGLQMGRGWVQLS